MTKESEITIGGTRLTDAQSMAVRLAVNVGLSHVENAINRELLGEMGHPLSERLREIASIIVMDQHHQTNADRGSPNAN